MLDDPAGRPGAAAQARRRSAQTATKLSYKDQRELDALPERIQDLEARMEALDETLADPDFFARPYEETSPVVQVREETRSELDAAMERWLELEERRETLEGARP